MNDLPLIHWGIPGMKWGVRKARNAIGKALGPKVTTKLQKGKDGKTYLVKTVPNSQNKYTIGKKNDVISKKEASPKQVQQFLKNQQKQKVKDVINRERAVKAGKAVAALITVYNAYKVVEIFTGMPSASGRTSNTNYSQAYKEWLAKG